MSLQTLLGELRAPGVTRTRLGAGVLALIVVTLVILAVLAWPLILLAGRAAPPGLKAPSPADRSQRSAVFAQRNTLGEERFSARWPFYPMPPKIVQKPSDPAPLRYAGPQLIAMINGAAWFADGKRLKPGDPAQDELEVLELAPPWTAKVRWQGGEFTVTLFERQPVSLTGALDDMRRGSPSTTPAATPRPAAPSATTPNPPLATTSTTPPAATPGAPASPLMSFGGQPISIPLGAAGGQPQIITLPDGRQGVMQMVETTDPVTGAVVRQMSIGIPAGASAGSPASTVGLPLPAGAVPAQGAAVTEQAIIVPAPSVQPAQPAPPAPQGESPPQAHAAPKK